MPSISRRRVLKTAGIASLPGLLNAPYLASESESEAQKTRRNVKKTLRKYGELKKSRVFFYEDGELRAEVGDDELEVKKTTVEKLDTGTGSIQKLEFETGFSETIITSVDGRQRFVKLTEEKEEYTYSLNQNDINRRKGQIRDNIKKYKRNIRQDAKERLEKKEKNKEY